MKQVTKIWYNRYIGNQNNQGKEMSTLDIQNAIFNIKSTDELRRIQGAISSQLTHLSQQVKWRFNVGDRVGFDARRRGYVTGKVTKIMRKNIKVLADSGVVWTVGPNLLERA
jgi:hypothetical protein